MVHIPTDWKSPETGIYEIHLILHNLENIQLKFIAIPYGDKLIVNIFPCIKEKKTYSMIVQTLKYVNPYSNNPCLRYMNLKEISHKYKEYNNLIYYMLFIKKTYDISQNFSGLKIN